MGLHAPSIAPAPVRIAAIFVLDEDGMIVDEEDRYQSSGHRPDFDRQFRHLRRALVDLREAEVRILCGQ